MTHVTAERDERKNGQNTSSADQVPLRKVELCELDEVTRLQTRPHKIGYVDAPNVHIVRIVHISDTHGNHDIIGIPDGDILIHSGDFFDWNDVRPFEDQMLQLDDFFAKQTHKSKVRNLQCK